MHFWHAYHSQIYTTLQQLEDEALLTSELEGEDDKRNKRLYTITEAGKKDLHQWLDEPLLELVSAKETLLVRIFFSAEREQQDILDELRVQRRLHQRKLEQYQGLNDSQMKQIIPDSDEEASQQLPFWKATLRFGIAYEEMYLQWLGEVINMVEARH